ncbi:hypothetical protein BGX38DRAFT_326178 [Terfezia claveryi]|nr:hypothetical protein BGX38DRAFT_326178 [Terfezia claveryi]
MSRASSSAFQLRRVLLQTKQVYVALALSLVGTLCTAQKILLFLLSGGLISVAAANQTSRLPKRLVAAKACFLFNAIKYVHMSPSPSLCRPEVACWLWSTMEKPNSWPNKPTGLLENCSFISEDSDRN